MDKEGELQTGPSIEDVGCLLYRLAAFDELLLLSLLACYRGAAVYNEWSAVRKSALRESAFSSLVDVAHKFWRRPSEPAATFNMLYAKSEAFMEVKPALADGISSTRYLHLSCQAHTDALHHPTANTIH